MSSAQILGMGLRTMNALRLGNRCIKSNPQDLLFKKASLRLE